MVRKRTRKYDSDDNDSDSDVEFDVEHQSRPAAKKYSLRERKKAPLVTDFDYYGLDDEDGEAKKPSSDDEDFEVEPDTNEARSYFEPEPDVDPQNSEGLIDFEDVIRADIVVNKNKIDYDNLIQKTEIKLTQPKRRGRKPKNRTDDVKKEEPDSNDAFQPVQLGTLQKLEKKENGDEKENCTNKEVMATVQPEISLEGQEGLPNGDILNNIEKSDTIKEDDGTDGGNSIASKTTSPETPQIQDTSELKKVEEDQKVVEEEEDDDVIVLEVKQDVIVLDD